jgi:hypothetical protein
MNSEWNWTQGPICEYSVCSEYMNQCPSRLIVKVRRSCEAGKLKSDCGDSGSKKYELVYGGAYSRVWRSLRLTGVWSQEVGFVLVRLAGIWLQSP